MRERSDKRRRGERGILPLQRQPHGGNRGFDLMRPGGVVFDGIPVAGIGRGLQFGALLPQVQQQGAEILLRQAFRRGQFPQQFGGKIAQPGKGAMALLGTAVIPAGEAQPHQ